MSYNYDTEQWESEQPRLLFPDHENAYLAKMHHTADCICPHCDAMCVLGVQWGEDQPPERSDMIVVCWDCGERFCTSWELVPEFGDTHPIASEPKP